MIGMTEDRTGTFINGRGQTLHTVEFVPDGKPEALLIFHHGYGEHTGRYDHGKAHGPILIPLFMSRLDDLQELLKVPVCNVSLITDAWALNFAWPSS